MKMNKQNTDTLFARIRMNHGLEHATINILEKRYPGLRLSGISTPFGFYIFGSLTTSILADAILDAQREVSAGKRYLVIHDRCGTNLATGGILTALAAWLSLLGARRNFRDYLERLPLAIVLATCALYFSPALGVRIQQKITTTSLVHKLEIVNITQGNWGKQRRFSVKTRTKNTHG
jgi:hypothetical protein